jgi:hypothetical protein
MERVSPDPKAKLNWSEDNAWIWSFMSLKNAKRSRDNSWIGSFVTLQQRMRGPTACMELDVRDP